MAGKGKKKEERPADELKLEEEGMTVVGQGQIVTWEKGMRVHGTYLGRRPGKYRPLLRIRVGEEVLTYATPTILDDRFQDVPVGSLVTIVCRGQTIPSSSGQDAWDFAVGYKAPKGGTN